VRPESSHPVVRAIPSAAERRRDGRGSGLGRALVRQIARHHGGDAICLAADGGGSCFRVMLPVVGRCRAGTTIFAHPLGRHNDRVSARNASAERAFAQRAHSPPSHAASIVPDRRQQMTRATLDPAGAFGRHPLQPHQLTDRLTRTEDTIVLCHLGVPRIDPDDWSLSIDGRVRRPMRLTLSEIMRRRRVEFASIHQCCGSPLKPQFPTRRICNVVWGGVPLSHLLAECEPDSSARYVWSSGADYGVFEGDRVDAFVKDLPLDRAAADVLIAYKMNGSPLRPENGYPVRLVVPGYYGTNSVKWLNRITLADTRAPGPFTTRWY
jgi:DMSO/TMAO reductase YedYZ molybdopterin-dependent catalytic subunit